jgi:nucleotide-binding universal stress UspA family protein
MTTMLTVGDRPEQTLGDGGGRVVVGVDDGPGGLAALRWAVDLARSTGAPLVAVRVWALGLPRHGGRRRRGDGRRHVVLAFQGAEPRAAAAKLTRRAFHAATGGIPSDLDVRIETPEGNPGPVLTQLALASDDVLVVGTTPGHSLKRAVHGSVSAYCSKHLPSRVAVVGAGDPGPLASSQSSLALAGDQARGHRRRFRAR